MLKNVSSGRLLVLALTTGCKIKNRKSHLSTRPPWYHLSTFYPPFSRRLLAWFCVSRYNPLHFGPFFGDPESALTNCKKTTSAGKTGQICSGVAGVAAQDGSACRNTTNRMNQENCSLVPKRLSVVPNRLSVVPRSLSVVPNAPPVVPNEPSLVPKFASRHNQPQCFQHMSCDAVLFGTTKSQFLILHGKIAL
jgi:hypothetical protein